MINPNSERDKAVFYTNGTCNLKCRYCNIDKNPALAKVDKLLEESFIDPEYYFNRVKLYFERWQLKSVETWGGEPFLGMHRALPLFKKLIEYYPNLDSFFSSTNFSFTTWKEEFWNLINIFKDYPNRKFKYFLQLSVDGPTELNDFNRGEGVTERCLKNYYALLEDLKNDMLPENVTLGISLKGTLDTDSIRNLNTKEAIIEYYKFFEDNYLQQGIEVANIKPNINISFPIPNVAVPVPATVELGKIFAHYIALCRSIEKDIVAGRSELKLYQQITPFSETANNVALSYVSPYGYCGTGNSMVGFLPDDLIAICNEGFTEMVKEYQENASTGKYRRPDGSITFRQYVDTDQCLLCLTDDEYAQHEIKMRYYNQGLATAKLVGTVNEILALAMCGQVDSKYLNEIEALKAAIFIHARYAYCIKDNYNTNGTFTMLPLGTLKLFLNGAIELLLSQTEKEELLYANIGA